VEEMWRLGWGGRGRGVGMATPFVGMGGGECEGVLRSTS